jgi:uncharacterized protein (TIGR03067 family)
MLDFYMNKTARNTSQISTGALLRRRRAASVCLSVVLSVLLTNQSRADQLQNDFVKLQGPWWLYYAEQDGSMLLPTGSVQMQIDGNRFLVGSGTPASTLGEFAQDQMHWPKQINYMPLTGPNAGQVYLGIYNVIGSLQWVCFAAPGQPRPTEFFTFPGSGRIMNIWQKLP